MSNALPGLGPSGFEKQPLVELMKFEINVINVTKQMNFMVKPSVIK